MLEFSKEFLKIQLIKMLQCSIPTFFVTRNILYLYAAVYRESRFHELSSTCWFNKDEVSNVNDNKGGC